MITRCNYCGKRYERFANGDYSENDNQQCGCHPDNSDKEENDKN